MTRLAEGSSNSFDYVYDNNSNLSTLMLTAGASTVATGYSYNTLNQLVAISRNSSNLAKFVYDERNNLLSVNHSNGTFTA